MPQSLYNRFFLSYCIWFFVLSYKKTHHSKLANNECNDPCDGHFWETCSFKNRSMYASLTKPIVSRRGRHLTKLRCIIKRFRSFIANALWKNIFIRKLSQTYLFCEKYPYCIYSNIFSNMKMNNFEIWDSRLSLASYLH